MAGLANRRRIALGGTKIEASGSGAEAPAVGAAGTGIAARVTAEARAAFLTPMVSPNKYASEELTATAINPTKSQLAI